MGYRSDIDSVNANKVSEAPSDGKEYTRKNGSWIVATGGGGGGSGVIDGGGPSSSYSGEPSIDWGGP
jgi:hypothetical protein